MALEVIEQETGTTSTVSNEQEQTQEVIPPVETKPEDKVDEFKLPTTKEEYEISVKAAVNKEKTNFLKELGVKSVKEYKESISKAEEALSKHEELIKQSEELKNQKESISQEYENLKQTSALDRLGVKEEYREDLVKLAKDKVDDNNSFETVVKNLVETKYQYTVQKPQVKIGTEKTEQESGQSTSSELHKKYSWIK